MKTALEVIGGETGLKTLVNHFYDLIETHPRGASIMSLHFRGHGLAHVREEQFNFLAGFLGGRRYYEEKHGNMDVRLMHAHVPIAESDAEDWLFLMDVALQDQGHTGPEIEKVRAAFRRVAMILVNRKPGDEAPLS